MFSKPSAGTKNAPGYNQAASAGDRKRRTPGSVTQRIEPVTRVRRKPKALVPGFVELPECLFNEFELCIVAACHQDQQQMPRRFRNLMSVCVLPDLGWVLKAVHELA